MRGVVAYAAFYKPHYIMMFDCNCEAIMNANEKKISMNKSTTTELWNIILQFGDKWVRIELILFLKF